MAHVIRCNGHRREWHIDWYPWCLAEGMQMEGAGQSRSSVSWRFKLHEVSATEAGHSLEAVCPALAHATVSLLVLER